MTKRIFLEIKQFEQVIISLLRQVKIKNATKSPKHQIAQKADSQ